MILRDTCETDTFTTVMLFKYGFTLHPLSYVPIYVSAGGCPLPTLQVALLATLNPGV